ncbi:MAG: hypothetical protein GF417_01655 [Candidatus Latescibacteria bacterium]|nr:hypothetical protein [bacterium]MBD3423132.1 hypothetical protein [Candidatus Latescibacterota bacterium]
MRETKIRILVIRFSSLGDLILMIPLLRHLRAAFPRGEIDIATKDKYSGLFSGYQLVNSIHTLKGGSLSELLRMKNRLRKRRYNIVIDAHNVIRSNILYWGIPAEKKAQLKKEQLRKFLLIKFGINLYHEITHQHDRYMKLAWKIGLSKDKDLPPFQLPADAELRAGNFIKELDPEAEITLSVAPGARWDTKRWSEQNYREIIKRVSDMGFNTVIVGGREEVELAERISGSTEERLVNTAGKLSILETASILGRSDLLLTNDSALLHLSELVGTPVLALFGPTVREFGFYPRMAKSRVLEIGAECRPCSRNGARPCRYPEKLCLDSIKPESVLESILSILNLKRNVKRTESRSSGDI